MSDIPTTKKINMSLDDLIKKNKDDKRNSKKLIKYNLKNKIILTLLNRAQ